MNKETPMATLVCLRVDFTFSHFSGFSVETRFFSTQVVSYLCSTAFNITFPGEISSVCSTNKRTGPEDLPQVLLRASGFLNTLKRT